MFKLHEILFVHANCGAGWFSPLTTTQYAVYFRLDYGLSHFRPRTVFCHHDRLHRLRSTRLNGVCHRSKLTVTEGRLKCSLFS